MYAYPMQLLWTHWKKQPNAFTDLSYHINHSIWREHVLKTTIAQLAEHENEEVTLGAWLTNKRSSGNIAFLQLRDGSGFVQDVVRKNDVLKVFYMSSKMLRISTSIIIRCTVGKVTRSKICYELSVSTTEVIQLLS